MSEFDPELDGTTGDDFGGAGSDSRDSGSSSGIVNPSDIEPKRGRGRPRKDGSAAGSDRKPAGRRDKRAPGSDEKTSDRPSVKVSADGLSFLAFQLGAMIAMKTKQESLMLDDAEAKQIGEAAANVLDQFKVKIDPKAAAIGGLIMTVSGIYGGKIMAIRANSAMNRAS